MCQRYPRSAAKTSGGNRPNNGLPGTSVRDQKKLEEPKALRDGKRRGETGQKKVSPGGEGLTDKPTGRANGECSKWARWAFGAKDGWQE